MRACLTEALRIRKGKAVLIPEKCIDCGMCLRVCPVGAIVAATLDTAYLSGFKLKVALPSAVLYSQFPQCDTPASINRALKLCGFDEVWDLSTEIELVNRAIRDCLQNWKGTYPLISSSCPVIVRLLQVAYPTMVGQILPIEVPRELAGRALKKHYSEKYGISEDDIAAIYITPCQAKTISIFKPAEQVKSILDGAIGISELYNRLLYTMREMEEMNPDDKCDIGSDLLLSWATPEGQASNLSRHRYLQITGLPNVIRVFDDIEKGKLRNIDFLECYACRGGCIGGNLTVDNVYVARGKLLHLMSQRREPSQKFKDEVERRYQTEDFSLKAPVKPRAQTPDGAGLLERVKRRKKAEEVFSILPGLNCGLCGAPNCRAHAEDVSAGESSADHCVILSKDRIDYLRSIYLKRKNADTE